MVPQKVKSQKVWTKFKQVSETRILNSLGFRCFRLRISVSLHSNTGHYLGNQSFENDKGNTVPARVSFTTGRLLRNNVVFL